MQVHVPEVQVIPVPQRLPQRPQLFGSLATSAQPPPVQAIAPAPHMHMPEEHVPPAHDRPHAPQLFASVARSAQVVAQATREPPHAHAPAVQVEPVGHARPHVPQFAPSVWRLTHTPLHGTIPPVHVSGWQVPLVQTSVRLQPLPQRPQLARSVDASTQLAPQRIRLPVQLVTGTSTAV